MALRPGRLALSQSRLPLSAAPADRQADGQTEITRLILVVRPTGIEPVSKASEASILSVGRRSQRTLLRVQASGNFGPVSRTLECDSRYGRLQGAVVRHEGYRFSRFASTKSSVGAFPSIGMSSIIEGLAGCCSKEYMCRFAACRRRV